LNCMISVLNVQDSKKKGKDLASWEADLKRREKVIFFIPWLNTSICKCSTWFMLF
jgi:peroxiredoxin